MSDYDDGWNEGFDLGARKVKELQVELKERSGLTRMQVNDILMEHEDLEAELKMHNAKLEAELESAETYRDLALEANAKLQVELESADEANAKLQAEVQSLLWELANYEARSE